MFLFESEIAENNFLPLNWTSSIMRLRARSFRIDTSMLSAQGSFSGLSEKSLKFHKEHKISNHLALPLDAQFEKQ